MEKQQPASSPEIRAKIGVRPRAPNPSGRRSARREVRLFAIASGIGKFCLLEKKLFVLVCMSTLCAPVCPLFMLLNVYCFCSGVSIVCAFLLFTFLYINCIATVGAYVHYARLHNFGKRLRIMFVSNVCNCFVLHF